MALSAKKRDQVERIAKHGLRLLDIFPNCLERDPVELCKKLHRLEKMGARVALRLCNDSTYKADQADRDEAKIMGLVNELLGNQTPTLGPCGCKRGQDRDNCPRCEGSGLAIDFPAVRVRPLVPIFLNRDPRGYALKIRDEYVRANKLAIETDWGGYGIICPEIS